MSDEQAVAAAPAAPEWPRTVKLQHPITFDEAISELVFQRGKLGIIKGITLVPGQVAMETLILIAARLCGQPTKVIEQLDGAARGIELATEEREEIAAFREALVEIVERHNAGPHVNRETVAHAA